MRVLVFDPYAGIEDDAVRTVDLDELLAASDAVSVHARATAETRHLINEDFLQRMKPGAFLVNTARESLLDERALLAALERGHVGGAALDVCEPDGLWPQFATLPQVIITPHLGGATVQTQERSLRMLVADLTRWAEGDEPLHRVLPIPAS